MTKPLLFLIALLITLGIFGWTSLRYIRFFMLTKPAFRVRNFGKRFRIMLNVAFGQSRIFRKPVLGLFHALVFWGFCIIIFGSIEMVIDGLSGSERFFKIFGVVYDVIIASGDIFGLLVGISIIIFLFRRLFLHIRRFQGIEMKPISHIDALVALTLILFLMISLLGMNSAYVEYKHLSMERVYGAYPVSHFLSGLFASMTPSAVYSVYQGCWWTHILTIFLFANILPYSKHFHVFMSIPNVFLCRLDPLGKFPNMDNVTREVKLMLDPNTAFAAAPADAPVTRFGVKDCEDVTWKNYLDSLSCTECGRCTSVCPANITGKMLSPRKVMMNLRARMKEKGPHLVRQGNDYTDNKSLVRDYISEEELWACTTCNACARECPIMINHPTLIVDMRRYLVMEEGSAPGELKSMFSYIENNGAPWQYSPEDRLLWARDLEMNIH